MSRRKTVTLPTSLVLQRHESGTNCGTLLERGVPDIDERSVHGTTVLELEGHVEENESSETACSNAPETDPVQNYSEYCATPLWLPTITHIGTIVRTTARRAHTSCLHGHTTPTATCESDRDQRTSESDRCAASHVLATPSSTKSRRNVPSPRTTVDAPPWKNTSAFTKILPDAESSFAWKPREVLHSLARSVNRHGQDEKSKNVRALSSQLPVGSLCPALLPALTLHCALRR